VILAEVDDANQEGQATRQIRELMFLQVGGGGGGGTGRRRRKMSRRRREGWWWW